MLFVYGRLKPLALERGGRPGRRFALRGLQALWWALTAKIAVQVVAPLDRVIHSAKAKPGTLYRRAA